MKFQLRFKRNGSCSYRYCDVSSVEQAPAAATEEANKYLSEQRENQFMRFGVEKPVRTVEVVECGKAGIAIRKGHRFNLKLCFIEYRFKDGRRERDDWYEPIAV